LNRSLISSLDLLLGNVLILFGCLDLPCNSRFAHF
jgi:hypothetical protein